MDNSNTQIGWKKGPTAQCEVCLLVWWILEEATTQKLDRKLLFEMSFDKNTNAGKCRQMPLN